MKRKFLTTLLSVMLVLCLSFSVTALFASADPVPDDDTYTTVVDMKDKSNFNGVFQPNGGAVVAGAVEDTWDFDTEAGTATSKSSLVTSDAVWSNFFYLYYNKADYKYFYMEVTLQHVSAAAGWSGLCYGVEDVTKPAKGASENPKGGLSFVQGNGVYTWHNLQINANEWNDTGKSATGFNGLTDTVHKLKVYKNKMQYWLNEEDPIVVDIDANDTAFTSGKVGVMVSNKAVAVKSMKITSLKEDGTVGSDEVIAANDLEVTGIENNAQATVGVPVPVTVSVLPAGAEGSYAFATDKDGAYFYDNKLLFKEAGEYHISFTLRGTEVKKEFAVTVTEPNRTGYNPYVLDEIGMNRFEPVMIAGGSGQGGVAANWSDLFTLQNGVIARNVTQAGAVGNDYGVLYLTGKETANFELIYSAKGNADNGWFGVQFAMKDKTKAGNQDGAFAFMQNTSGAHNATLWGGPSSGIGGPAGLEGGTPTYLHNTTFSVFKLRVLNGNVQFFVDDMINPKVTKTVTNDLTGAIGLFADGGCNAQFKDIYFAPLDSEGNPEEFKAITSVTIENKPVEAYVGESLELNAVIAPADATEQAIVYATSNPEVATVNAVGKVTYLAKGDVTITATALGDSTKSDSFTVTVETKIVAVPVEKVAIGNKVEEALVGEELVLQVTVSPADATNPSLLFSSSNETVAKVDENGKVTFLRRGTAIISVRAAADSTKTDDFEVTVDWEQPNTQGYNHYTLNEVGMNAFEAVSIPGDQGNGGSVVNWDTLFTLENGVLTRNVTDAGHVGNDYGALYFKYKTMKNFEIVYRATGNEDNGWFGVQFAMTDKTQAGNQKGVFAFMQNSACKATLWGGGNSVGGPTEADSLSYRRNEFSTFKLRVFNGEISFYVDNMETPSVTKTVSDDLTGGVALFADGGCGAQFKDVALALLDDEGNVIDYVSVQSIEITNKPTEAFVGEALELNVTLAPANATEKDVIYTSSNAEIATVNAAGKVTYLAEGEVTITATAVGDADQSDSFTIFVETKEVAIPVRLVSINNKVAEASIGEEFTLQVSIAPENASNKTLLFVSSDETIATVDDNGRVTFLKRGTVTITVRAAADGTKTDSMNVTVDWEQPNTEGYIQYPLTAVGMNAFEAIFIAGGSGNGGVSKDWNELFTLENGVITRKDTAGEGGPEIDLTALYFNNKTLKNFEIVYKATGNDNNGWFGVQFAMTDKTQAGNQKGVFAFMQNSAHKATLWGGGNGVGGPTEIDTPSYQQNQFSTFKLRVFNGEVLFYVDDMKTPNVSKTVSDDLTGAISLFASGDCGAQFKDVALALLDDEGNVIDYVSVQSVTIQNKTESAYVGETLNLDVTLAPANATDFTVLYASSDPTVATVNGEGKVAFLSAGEVTITVTAKDDASKTDSVTITVTKKVIGVSSVSISNKTTTATVGDKLTLQVKVEPTGASNKNLKFETSDETVATVSETGVVTFIKAGNVTITVKSAADETKSDSFTVTVAEKTGGDVTPEPKPEKGCGSNIAAGSVAIAAGLLVAAVTVLSLKKKHD